MDWKLAVKEERAALRRIVALLFALANLAESAGRRSPLVRRFVIWVLRQAETLARDFAVGEQEASASMPVGPFSDSPDDPAEAMRLALSFRDLACELERQARLGFPVEGCVEQAGLARGGAFRTLDTNDFLSALRLAFANITFRAACATGPPE